MPWNLRREFHIDINASYGSIVLQGASQKWPTPTVPTITAGDSMPLRLYFWEKNAVTGLYAAADPGLGAVLVFSGRPAGAPADSSLLFVATAFTEIETGVWESTLDLATAELNAHIAADPEGAKTILGEIEVRSDSGNTVRSSYQFDLIVRPEVYRGDDAGPTPLPTVIGDTVPNNGAAAAASLIPGGGADNIVVLTAVVSGPTGNSITGEIASPAVQAATSVAVTGSDIVVTPGTKAQMIVSAASDPAVDGAMLFYVGNTPSLGDIWATSGVVTPTLDTPTGDGIRLYSDGSSASTLQLYVADAKTAEWSDYSPGLWLELDTLTPVSGSSVGNITLFASVSSAQQVIDSINDDPSASALVIASASGAATGSVDIVAQAALTDGGLGATAAPPYIRVAGGFLYIQDAGIWKKAALSTL